LSNEELDMTDAVIAGGGVGGPAAEDATALARCPSESPAHVPTAVTSYETARAPVDRDESTNVTGQQRFLPSAGRSETGRPRQGTAKPRAQSGLASFGFAYSNDPSGNYEMTVASNSLDVGAPSDSGTSGIGMKPAGSGRVVEVSHDDPVRVVLAEDDVLLREGLASLLDGLGFDVVGQAGDGTQLFEMVRDQNPELVVTDIRMPPTHTTEGLDTAKAIRAERPSIGILVLSAHVDVEHAMELLASGQSIGYLLKSRVIDVADFVDTLQRIAKGASVVDPALVQDLVASGRRDDPLASLTARERDVLALMAEGRSNAGIAQRIWVAEGTVQKHVRSILSKLHLPDIGDDHHRRVLAVITFLGAR
jgi:DNA-binding NarL/FixJ family response regulator